jgi:serine/threonine protein phosphatase 1
VFLGDYVDRGPDSAKVVARVRRLPDTTPAKVVALRGNHEDAWVRVVERGWPEFVMPPGNGCFEALRSFVGGEAPTEDDAPSDDELAALLTGSFLPLDVVDWFRTLPYWYEDEHALYVHAGLPKKNGRWLHPSEVEDPVALLWTRDMDFVENYRGKRVVFGHTSTICLPADLSGHTPGDPTDLWAGVDVLGVDTRCGKGGFLTAVEFPALLVYESR